MQHLRMPLSGTSTQLCVDRSALRSLQSTERDCHHYLSSAVALGGDYCADLFPEPPARTCVPCNPPPVPHWDRACPHQELGKCGLN
ncbi:hypothetical protein P7K49_018717 [Saguinus oedipus]|uniref:Uncharacterized protein n=1 Tax=Saguinus oedipus TaxID=9490 RepID=A0ABQ9V661_SAGOE|nr:hypothetical protein P7K49_018717 [Saguinus oedipus]